MPQPLEEAPAEAALERLPVPDDQRLSLVLYIDNLAIRPSNRNAVFDALRSFLQRSLREEDQAMVVTYNGDLEVRHSFTHRLEDLLPTLAEIEKDGGRGVELDLDLSLLLEEMAASGGGPSGPVGSLVEPVQQASGSLEAVRAYAQKVNLRTRQSIRGVGLFLEQLAGLSGRKALLYVSDGLHLRPADAVLRAWQNRFGRDSLELQGGGLFSEMQDYDLTSDFERLGRLANAEGVVLHTLDASRYQGNSSVAADAFSRRADSLWAAELDGVQTLSLQASLRIMAESTGGRALLRQADVGKALEGLTQDLGTYYSLGFEPIPGEKGFQKVHVEVRRKGLRVRHRDGYEIKTAEQKTAERAVAAALFKQADNPLGVALEAGGDQPMDDGNFEVPVLVKIPLGQLVLVPQPEVHAGKVSLYLVAKDEKGRVSPVRRVSFPVRVPNKDLFTALGQHISYTFKLQLRRGQQTVAVGVRDEVAAVTALQTLDLVLPGETG